MTRKFLIDFLGWGILLWLIGYILGIVFYMFLPSSIIGWVIMPIGVLISLFILIKKIQSTSLKYYLIVALVWTLIAIIFDYFFLVKIFKPADGYYKLDVYLYYGLTFLLPILVGLRKKQS